MAHAPKKTSNILALLGNFKFSLFLISVVITQVAFNMMNITLIFLVYYLTNSNTSVAILIFCAMTPQVFLSFFGGVLSDKVDKKKVLVIGNITRALIVLMLFLAYKNVYAIYLFSFLMSSITQFYVPAEAPFIPHLIKKNMLLRANALFSIAFFGSVLGGYILSGPAIQVLGRNEVFLLISGLFLVAAACAFLLPNARPLKREKVYFGNLFSSAKNDFKESIVDLMAKGGTATQAFSLLVLAQVLIYALATIMPDYAEKLLRIDAENVSLFIFAPATFGMIVSSFVIGHFFHSKARRSLVTIGIVGSGCAVLLLPVFTKFPPPSSILFASFFSFLAGFFNAYIFIPSQTALQERTSQAHRSKIYGLLFSAIGICSFVPILMAGVFSDIVGVNQTLIALGAGVVMIAIIKDKIHSSILVNFFLFVQKRMGGGS